MMIAAEGFRDSRSSIITAMLIIGYPVFVFIVLKLLGFQYFGTNVNGWLIGTVLLSGGVIFIYGLPGMLLNLQKGIPNSGYFIKESGVYLDGKEIKGADPQSFEEIVRDNRHAKDQSKVFYHGKVVAGADPASFSAIEPPTDSSEAYTYSEPSPVYWRDLHNIYYLGKIVEGADRNSFTHFASLYAKDISHVYYQNTILDEADPDKFRFINQNSIATDGNNLYIYNRRSKIDLDLESFAVVEDEYGTFCTDKNNVYLLFYQREELLVKVEGADLPTFKLLERSYAVDKNHVYFYGYYARNKQTLHRLEGIIPENFKVGYDEATESEATDGERYFMYGKEVMPRK